ncbi:MAG: hypothetical protein FWG40_11270 [Peptococcaceae bacterium]|nr:hypothetical protein [Peptococcaceae bacterium]
MRFNLVSQMIGGILLIVLAIMFMVWWEQYLYGIIVLLCGIVLAGICFKQLMDHNSGQILQKEQMKIVQDIDSVADISDPMAIAVKISDALPKGKFSIFLNGVKIGNIQYGEVLEFSTSKEQNLVKVGKLNGGPFNWPESGYVFDARQFESPVNLEITHNNLLVSLVNVEAQKAQ